MRRISIFIGLASLSACGGGDSTPAAPTGQVAAVAGGQEITSSDVRLELGGLGDRAAPAQQAQALQAVVNRKLLSAAARQRGVDKAPASAMLLAKAQELALIQLLQQSIVQRVPKPSPEEASIYIQDNPASFAQRHLVSVDQLIIPQAPRALVRQLEPVKSLEQAIALIDAAKVPYRTGAAVVDTATIEAAPARQIGALPVGAVFLSGNAQGVIVSRVSTSRVAPLTGPAATQAAQQAIYVKRVSDQVRGQFEGIIKAGQAGVRVNPAFRGPAARPSAAPSTPAR